MIRLRKLYTAVFATTDAAAQITIQRPARIIGVSWAIAAAALDTAATKRFTHQAQLSFESRGNFATNDAFTIIAESWKAQQSTSIGTDAGPGLIDLSRNHQVLGLDLPVQVGDVIYLHLLVQDDALDYSFLSAMVHLMEGR